MIFNIPLIKRLKDYAKNQVDNYDFGIFADYRAGNKEKQYTGILAEAVICDFLGYPLPNGSEGYDGGVDFRNKNSAAFDVKSMRRMVDVKDHYKHNYYAAQLSHAAHYFIFTSHNLKTDYLQVCGYLPAKLILRKGIFYGAGLKHSKDDHTDFTNKYPMFEFIQKDIFQFSGPDLFKKEIERLEMSIQAR
jgi:hypothetical protein